LHADVHHVRIRVAISFRCGDHSLEITIDQMASAEHITDTADDDCGAPVAEVVWVRAAFLRPPQRNQFLDFICEGRDELRRAVESLLAANQAPAMS